MRLSSVLTRTAFAGILAAPCAQLGALEVATGAMLGPRYGASHFYVRSGPGATWSRTYEGGRYRGKARGSLVLVRVTQGLFDDEWLRERPFDPDGNTARLIAQLDLYRQHGLAGIVVSLQGSDPGYSQQRNGVSRGASADLGERSGALVSAYRRDGSLKPAWMERLDRLLESADSKGLIVCLVLFQQDQDESLESPEAIVAAAGNVARHLVERNHRNVIIDVANAWDEPEGRWDHRRFVPRFVEQLIRAVRQPFQTASFSLPIGASSGAAMLYPMSLARLCDVVLLQGDGRSVADKLARSREFKQYGRPVLMVSDSNDGEGTADALANEVSVARAYIESASGWSFAPSPAASRFPFDYGVADSAEVDDSWEAPRRQRARARAMLEAIARIVLRRPPSTTARKKRG